MVRSGRVFRTLVAATVALAVPTSVVWWPITNIPGLGILTAGDVTLCVLWCLTLPLLLTASQSPLRRLGGAIVISALLTGTLACAGAAIFGSNNSLALEFGMYMKR